MGIVNKHHGMALLGGVLFVSTLGASFVASGVKERAYAASPNPYQWVLGRGFPRNNSERYTTRLMTGWTPHLGANSSKRGINIYNTTNGKALIAKERRSSNLLSPGNKTVGLDWLTRREARANMRRQQITFHRRGRLRSEPVRYGEVVSIHFFRGRGKPGYLEYKRRKWGINLGFDQADQMEWKIVGRGIRDGAEVRHRQARGGVPGYSQPVALYNTKAKDFLVYCKRKWGVNLKWAKTCK